MTFVGFVEKTAPMPITDAQKKLFEMYEQAERKEQRMYVCFPRVAGRSMILEIIKKWKAERK